MQIRSWLKANIDKSSLVHLSFFYSFFSSFVKIPNGFPSFCHRHFTFLPQKPFGFLLPGRTVSGCGVLLIATHRMGSCPPVSLLLLSSPLLSALKPWCTLSRPFLCQRYLLVFVSSTILLPSISSFFLCPSTLLPHNFCLCSQWFPLPF